MGQGDLAGARRSAAADQPGRRDRVVRGAKRARRETTVRRRPAGDAGDLRHLDRLRHGPARAGSRAAGAPPSTCPRPGGPIDQDSVPAGRGDLEPHAQRRLAAQVGEVGQIGRGAAAAPAAASSGAASPRDRAPGRRERRQRHHLDPLDQAGLARVRHRHGDSLTAGRRGRLGHRQQAAGPPGSSRRGRALPPATRIRAAAAAPDPRPPGSPAAIARSKPGPALRRSAGARLAVIRLQRELEAAVDDRGAHPLARLAHSGVRQARRARTRAGRGGCRSRRRRAPRRRPGSRVFGSERARERR